MQKGVLVVDPERIAAGSRGSSEATPPGKRRMPVFDPEGITATLACRSRCDPFRIESHSIPSDRWCALKANHRLMAVTPVGVKACLLPLRHVASRNKTRIKTKLLNCYLSHSPGRASGAMRSQAERRSLGSSLIVRCSANVELSIQTNISSKIQNFRGAFLNRSHLS